MQNHQLSDALELIIKFAAVCGILATTATGFWKFFHKRVEYDDLYRKLSVLKVYYDLTTVPPNHPVATALSHITLPPLLLSPTANPSKRVGNGRVWTILFGSFPSALLALIFTQAETSGHQVPPVYVGSSGLVLAIVVFALVSRRITRVSNDFARFLIAFLLGVPVALVCVFLAAAMLGAGK